MIGDFKLTVIRLSILTTTYRGDIHNVATSD